MTPRNRPHAAFRDDGTAWRGRSKEERAQDAVGQAVHLLDQIRIVRNNAVHPKPSPNLEAAHRALGLPWPVLDHAAAWDSVRGNAEKAVNALQETIRAART